MKEQLSARCKICGIASDEVRFAKELLANKASASGTGSFICEGLWAAEKLIRRGIPVSHFFLNGDALNTGKIPQQDFPLVSHMIDYAEESYLISEKACRKISDRDGADYCFMIAQMKILSLEELPLQENMLIMVLDGQEQPGNVGAILRSLDCAGGAGAILTNRRVKPTHSRLIRSSLGAAFLLPLADAGMEETGEWLVKHQFKAVLTDLSAVKSYRDIDYSGRIAIVAGNEHSGISPYWRTLSVAEPVIIPMLGSCESLNVGFASTLVAYEAGLRQRGLSGATF